MLGLVLCLCLSTVSYLEFLWNHHAQPTVFLTIRSCRDEQRVSTRATAWWSFLFEHYEKIASLIPVPFFRTATQPTCHLYKINLHLPIVLLVIKSSCLLFYMRTLARLLVWLYRKPCYWILQKQNQPFTHIRSVSLTSPAMNPSRLK